MVTVTAMMFLGGLAIWLTKSANAASRPAPSLQIEQGLSASGTLLLASIITLAAHRLLSRIF